MMIIKEVITVIHFQILLLFPQKNANWSLPPNKFSVESDVF